MKTRLIMAGLALAIWVGTAIAQPVTRDQELSELRTEVVRLAAELSSTRVDLKMMIQLHRDLLDKMMQMPFASPGQADASMVSAVSEIQATLVEFRERLTEMEKNRLPPALQRDPKLAASLKSIEARLEVVSQRLGQLEILQKPVTSSVQKETPATKAVPAAAAAPKQDPPAPNTSVAVSTSDVAPPTAEAATCRPSRRFSRFRN